MGMLRDGFAYINKPLTVLALLVLFLNAGELQSAQPENLLRDFSSAQLIISTSGSRCVLFDVYVAQTPSQRNQGLMHIKSMGTYEGMIFLYRENTDISMWMKNTLISLDMLFIGNDLKIANMHPDAIPHSEKIISSGLPVVGVIELNAGSIKRFNIATGNQIIFPAG